MLKLEALGSNELNDTSNLTANHSKIDSVKGQTILKKDLLSNEILQIKGNESVNNTSTKIKLLITELNKSNNVDAIFRYEEGKIKVYSKDYKNSAYMTIVGSNGKIGNNGKENIQKYLASNSRNNLINWANKWLNKWGIDNDNVTVLNWDGTVEQVDSSKNIMNPNKVTVLNWDGSVEQIDSNGITDDSNTVTVIPWGDDKVKKIHVDNKKLAKNKVTIIPWGSNGEVEYVDTNHNNIVNGENETEIDIEGTEEGIMTMLDELNQENELGVNYKYDGGKIKLYANNNKNSAYMTIFDKNGYTTNTGLANIEKYLDVDNPKESLISWAEKKLERWNA